MFERRVEQPDGADDIRVDEYARAIDRAVDMAFRGQMHDRIDLFLCHQRPHERRIADVGLDEAVVRGRRHVTQRVQIAGIGELVDVNDSQPAGDQQPNDSAADEAGAPSNNYDKDIYNGDIGFIRSLDMIEQRLTVDFYGRSVTYDWSDVDELTLAYVISVHKAQGSEFPVVVMPIVTQHYTMLQRNLLYTAITRASKLCVLAGSRRAISMAVRNNKVANRFTALQWRVGKEMGNPVSSV